MVQKMRWDPCVTHQGTDKVRTFISDYFSEKKQSVLFIGGAGFDPRSTNVALEIAKVCTSIRAVLVNEIRPDYSSSDLADHAEKNAKELKGAITDHKQLDIHIFSNDGAAIGGREAVKHLSAELLNRCSDIVVDISALSLGISFPIIRFLINKAQKSAKSRLNLHVFISPNPDLDAAIQPTSSEIADYVYGFKGGATLDEFEGAAKLWLPQLARGRNNMLGIIHTFVGPHDICPILPFPASNPRLGDELAEGFLTEFEDTWSLDMRNILYADEKNPLDLYRTILRLDDRRQPMFESVGGSLIVLSPTGSKVMALGALMAAVERDLPVAHLESIAYELKQGEMPHSDTTELLHVWLEGEAYPQPRPSIRAIP